MTKAQKRTGDLRALNAEATGTNCRDYRHADTLTTPADNGESTVGCTRADFTVLSFIAADGEERGVTLKLELNT